MSQRTLAVEWARIQSETARYQALTGTCMQLGPVHAKLVAEVLLVRTFLLIENALASICAKILCGAKYLDGTAALSLVAPHSSAAAWHQMKTHKRKRMIPYLKWSQEHVIRDNLLHTLGPADPFFSTMAGFATVLEEMRIVRNHIAHGSPSTRKQFQTVVQRYYGGLKRGVTPGRMLLTKALGPRPMLERHVIEARALIRAVVRG